MALCWQNKTLVSLQYFHPILLTRIFQLSYKYSLIKQGVKSGGMEAIIKLLSIHCIHHYLHALHPSLPPKSTKHHWTLYQSFSVQLTQHLLRLEQKIKQRNNNENWATRKTRPPCDEITLDTKPINMLTFTLHNL